MISKQKLLQWIKDKKFVYSVDDEDLLTDETTENFEGRLTILNLLDRAIELGEFVVDNGEEVKG